ncbi:hypothetical protein RclHR1_09900005 [Rhizophagus clarus]|uniref:Uncharacterized protein n=1 Tax=Rhizophagus clarus TaxID=94130 RepID=A0A2Z6SIK8_9GLOM|nr:hypothetical protein RclHR1_09900005 [Rhizophagus clarus]
MFDGMPKVQNSISRQTTKSRTPFQGGPLSLELHFEADYFKSWNSISRQTTLRVQNSFKGRLYDILKVWKKWTELFRMSRTSLGADYDISKSRTPLEAEYDISKIQTFHFKDWTLFEELVTIFKDYFESPDEAQTPFKDPGRRNTVHLSKVRDWIPRRNFEGLGLPGMLQNFKGALRSSFYYFFEIS